MRKNSIHREDIIEATIKLSAAVSLENVTTRKVAALLGISEGSIFNYFPSKSELLLSCFYYIDAYAEAAVLEVSMEGEDFFGGFRQLLNAYVDFFLQHPDYTKFYCQMRHSAYFESYRLVQDAPSFAALLGRMADYDPLLAPDSALSPMIGEIALGLALQIVCGVVPSSQKVRDKTFSLLCFGLQGPYATHL